MAMFRYSRRYTGPLQAVIFDWAGTTVDHGCIAPRACSSRSSNAAACRSMIFRRASRWACTNAII